MDRKHRRAGKHRIPRIGDGDFLSGWPPSLWGIVPLTTSVDQAREILRSKGVLGACEEYHFDRTGSTGIACWPEFNLNYRDGLVKFVEFMPSITITMADVVAARGEPEGVLSAYTDFPDGKIYTVLILFYESIWTMVSLVEQEPRTYTVTPDTRVAHISYSKPSPTVSASSQRVPWKGYGDYPASDATSD